VKVEKNSKKIQTKIANNCLFIKALVAHIGAVKGMSWESPRGPMTIDPETRDVIHNIYLRRVAQRLPQWNRARSHRG